MPTIRVDRDVFAFLQEHAKPFVDSPNTVLRRLLKVDSQNPSTLAEGGHPRVSRAKRVKGKRERAKAPHSSRRTKRQHAKAPAGAILPEEEYVMPILSMLAEHGGSGSARKVISAVGEQLGEKLTALDRERLASGAIRWENRAQFVRLRLIEEGLLSKDSPRGVWALTEAGRARLQLDHARSK